MSQLERIRANLEEAERLVALGGEVLQHRPNTTRERVRRDATARHAAELAHQRLQSAAAMLSLDVGDASAALREAMAEERTRDREKFRAGSAEGALGLFYAQLRDVREFHRRRPDAAAAAAPRGDDVARRLLEGAPDPLRGFSGEEMYGRCLDLHAHHDAFVNLAAAAHAGLATLSYHAYLGRFWRFDDGDGDGDGARHRRDPSYRRYVAGLANYLAEFARRAMPLEDYDRVLRDAESDFARWWDQGGFAWARVVQSHPLVASEDRVVVAARAAAAGRLASTSLIADDGTVLLENAVSADQLAAVGLERLKAELLRRGLPVGGTALERARRLFATRGQTAEDVLVEQSLAGRVGRTAAAKRRRQHRHIALNEPDAKNEARELCAAEFRVFSLSIHLHKQILETQRMVERKQSRVRFDGAGAPPLEDEEFGVDGAGAGADGDDDDDDDDGNARRSAHVAVDEDGRPLPYWLYKLRGLNVEYKCELCGNMSYFGPTSFEQHFLAVRHSQALQALGIPNRPDFTFVTKIADAVALWKTIREREVRSGAWSSTMEEVEDREGNVMSRKTYQDLVRQRLIDE